jgi:hypothetical protein
MGSILWAFMGTWWYWATLALFLFIGLVTAPGRIGRIACHWGLHDTHEIPSYPGHVRVICVRCRDKWETLV